MNDIMDRTPSESNYSDTGCLRRRAAYKFHVCRNSLNVARKSVSTIAFQRTNVGNFIRRAEKIQSMINGFDLSNTKWNCISLKKKSYK